MKHVAVRIYPGTEASTRTPRTHTRAHTLSQQHVKFWLGGVVTGSLYGFHSIQAYSPMGRRGEDQAPFHIPMCGAPEQMVNKCTCYYTCNLQPQFTSSIASGSMGAAVKLWGWSHLLRSWLQCERLTRNSGSVSVNRQHEVRTRFWGIAFHSLPLQFQIFHDSLSYI